MHIRLQSYIRLYLCTPDRTGGHKLICCGYQDFTEVTVALNVRLVTQ